jgi:hypothetical protein
MHTEARHLTRTFSILWILALIAGSGSAQFVQQGGKLVGTGGSATAQQAHRVSISADGNTAVSGSLSDNDGIGAAWIFTRIGGVWSQQGLKLVGTEPGVAYRRGIAAAISGDGNTVMIGGWREATGGGGVWVFKRDGETWTQQGERIFANDTIGGAFFGHHIALSHDGNTAVVGGYADDGFKGAAWIFTRSGDVWTQQGPKLVGTGAVGPSTQGIGVGISGDGNTVIVGGSTDSGSVGPDVGIGAAWIFTRSGGVWTQQGEKLVGTGYVGTNSRQGMAVALSADGNTAMVGGYGDDSQHGATWVYTRTGGVWTQQGPKLVGLGAVGAARQGGQVSLSSDGNRAVIGAWYDNNRAGAAWVFERHDTTWSQKGSKLVGSGAIGEACQGGAVSIAADGKTIISGGYCDDFDRGAAWIFNEDTAAVHTGYGITSVTDVPSDQGGKVLLYWTAINLDTNLATLPYYSIWRSVEQVPSGASADLAMESMTPDFQGTAYRTTAADGKDYAWEWVANQPAHRFAEYSYAAPTLFDAMPGVSGKHYFLVSAHTNDPDVFYDSNVDSGYSVDNLAPAIPTNLAGNRVGTAIVLRWDASGEADFSHYELFRSTTPGFDPDAVIPLVTLREPAYVDANVPASPPYFYAVRAFDVHGNRSGKSNEFSSLLVGVETGEGPPAEFALGQNYPNPFNPATSIRYALPSAAHVKLSVFNVAGQEAMVLVNEMQGAGHHEVLVNAEALPTGVYVYRLSTGEFTDVKKMVVLR